MSILGAALHCIEYVPITSYFLFKKLFLKIIII